MLGVAEKNCDFQAFAQHTSPREHTQKEAQCQGLWNALI